MDGPSTRPERVSVRLHGTIESDGERYPVTVLSLSENGFTCLGAWLDQVGADLRLTVDLEVGEPAWSPRDGAALLAPDIDRVPFQAAAELTLRDLSRPFEVLIGARFVDLDPEETQRLREFLHVRAFRCRRRVRGGAIPIPSMRGPALTGQRPSDGSESSDADVVEPVWAP